MCFIEEVSGLFEALFAIRVAAELTETHLLGRFEGCLARYAVSYLVSRTRGLSNEKYLVSVVVVVLHALKCKFTAHLQQLLDVIHLHLGLEASDGFSARRVL